MHAHAHTPVPPRTGVSNLIKTGRTASTLLEEEAEAAPALSNVISFLPNPTQA